MKVRSLENLSCIGTDRVGVGSENAGKLTLCLVAVGPYSDEAISCCGDDGCAMLFQGSFAYCSCGEGVYAYGTRLNGGAVVSDQSISVEQPKCCACFITCDWRDRSPRGESKTVIGEVSGQGKSVPKGRRVSSRIEDRRDKERSSGQRAEGIPVSGIKGEEKGGGDLSAVAFRVCPAGQEFVQPGGSIGEPFEVGTAGNLFADHVDSGMTECQWQVSEGADECRNLVVDQVFFAIVSKAGREVISGLSLAVDVDVNSSASPTSQTRILEPGGGQCPTIGTRAVGPPAVHACRVSDVV